VLPVVTTWALGVAFVAVNWRTRPPRIRIGFGVLAVGFTLSSLAIAVNGGMPFSARSARFAGFTERLISQPGARYEQTSADTHLVVLGDVIPVPLLQKVISVGDVLMFVAICWLLVALARPGGTRAARPAKA
jgi:hypothetical protein